MAYSRILSIVLSAAFFLPGLRSQVVDVTLTLATNRIAPGETVLLQASAQIVPELAEAERIFSWYLDLVSTGSVVQVQSAQLQKPASDKDPATSSNGTSAGRGIRGIYDTFLNLPGAGKDRPVVLFTVPVTAAAPGRATFYLQAGSGVSELSDDFLVARKDGGEPLTGGRYQAAVAELEIVAPPSPPVFRATLSSFSPGDSSRLVLRYPTEPGWNYFVQSREGFGAGTAWVSDMNDPNNSGAVLVTNRGSARFYRILATK